MDYCSKLKTKVSLYGLLVEGGDGTKDLAKNVVEICNRNKKKEFKYLYSENDSILKKVEKIAKEIYHAKDIEADKKNKTTN